MNKQEAIQKLNEIEKEQAKLRAIIEAPESNQWQPEKGQDFFYVSYLGDVQKFHNAGGSLSDQVVRHGNAFKVKEEAEASLKYHVMNSEYDYWIPGVSKCTPSFEPKSLEYYHTGNRKWIVIERSFNWGNWKYNIYRWKRSEQ